SSRRAGRRPPPTPPGTGPGPARLLRRRSPPQAMRCGRPARDAARLHDPRPTWEDNGDGSAGGADACGTDVGRVAYPRVRHAGAGYRFRAAARPAAPTPAADRTPGCTERQEPAGTW